MPGYQPKNKRKPAFRKPYAKRRAKPVRKTNIGLAKKVMTLTRLIGTPEKKKYTSSIQDQAVGQCNVNANGYHVFNATPQMAQGNTSITRVGNNINLISSHFKFQFQAMSNWNTGCRVKIMLIRVIGAPTSASLVPADMFLNNTFITGGSIIDYNSDRNEQTFGNYQVLRTKTFRMKDNNHTNQLPIYTGSFGIKYKKHQIKFSADGSTSIVAGQLIMLIVADNGNASTTLVSSLAGTASTGTLTGCYYQMDLSHWYTDN